MTRRRLARDYETKAGSSRAMIHIAMAGNLAKRITGEPLQPGETTPQARQPQPFAI